MRKNIGNKTIAAGLIALAMMMTAAPITAQAAGLKSLQARGNVSYIALENCSQSAIVKRLKLLGVNSDCLSWVEDLLNQGCQITPDVETPTTPVEPETPTTPVEPETPTTPVEPETPTTPVEPETPTTPTTPAEPETPTTPTTPVEPETPTTSTTPTEPETSAPSQSESSFATRVIELVNEERAKEGLKPLTYDATIEQAALVRAKEIQTSFSHTRPNGSSFVTAMKEAGVTYRTAGENIAWGQKTPEQVVEAWMNSASHRANIMNANYGRIGVGHLTNAKGTSYWVQLFAN